MHSIDRTRIVASAPNSNNLSPCTCILEIDFNKFSLFEEYVLLFFNLKQGMTASHLS